MASIGQDLATIRRYLNKTVEEIHLDTKIPLTTLKRVEDGSIFSETEENPTYIRSFVRSYAKALKIDEDRVVKALDQQDAGNYNQLLLEAYPELTSGEVPVESLEGEDADPEEKKVQAVPETSTREVTLQGKEKEYESTPSPPTISSVNWAAMGHKFKRIDKTTPIWMIGLAVILIVALVTVFLIYEQDLFDDSGELPQNIESGNPPAGNEPQQSELSLDFQNSPPEASTEEMGPPPAELDETLYITVYAAHERLEPVRVWSDLKPQMDPYWVSHGTAFNFEFQDTIRIRGQYSRMLLFLNGHRIENFRQEHFNNDENAVELTRDFFNRDSRWGNPVTLEVPEDVAEPDTVQNRPTF
ncbi:MAG: helix-turn-helix domain-containing protein [Balneolaceae bacterium]